MPTEDAPEVIREANEVVGAEGLHVKANVPVFQHNRMMSNNNTFDKMIDQTAALMFGTLIPSVLARASETILSDKPSELVGEGMMGAIGSKMAYGAPPSGFTGVGLVPASPQGGVTS